MQITGMEIGFHQFILYVLDIAYCAWILKYFLAYFSTKVAVPITIVCIAVSSFLMVLIWKILQSINLPTGQQL
jgi:phosphotransferase system  glucose/maltose/N-acetylglucosamine-specific IIC component